MAQRFHVDASRHDVGGHQDLLLAGLESFQRGRALVLAPVAVDAPGRDAVPFDEIGQAIGAVLGPREHDRVLDDLAFQQFHQQRRLQFAAHRIGRLRNAHRRRRFPLEVDGEGVAQHLVSQHHDLARHGGAEKQRLPLRRDLSQDAPDVWQEPHVQHAIGFVQHEHLEVRHSRVGLAQVIEQAPGRRHNHADAAAKRVLLRAHADASEHGRSGHRRVHSQFLQVCVDLGGQLASGRQDERAGGAARLGHQPVQNREQKRGGLAAARHGAGQDVSALRRRWNRLILDGGRAQKPEFLDAFQQVRMERKTGKRHALAYLLRASRRPEPPHDRHQHEAAQHERGQQEQRGTHSAVQDVAHRKERRPDHRASGDPA